MPEYFISGLSLLSQTADIMPEGSILQFDKGFLITIGIQWFNVILLTAALIFILYKPVKKYMRDRAERIGNEIESARQSNEKASELKKSYENMIKKIEIEREEILNQAHRAAVEKREQLLLSARKDVMLLKKQADDEINAERENIAKDIKRQIIELSMLVAERFVEVSIDKDTQEKYIDEALADWSGQVWEK